MLGVMTQIAATAPGATRSGRTRRTAIALLQGLGLALFGIPVALTLLILVLLSIAFIPLGIGIVTTPPLVLLMRWFANLHRKYGERWFGTPVARPYKPKPHGDLRIFRTLGWVLSDPGTWRDLLWLFWACSLGFGLALIPLALVFQGVYGWVLMCGVWRPIYDATGGDWYGPIKVTSQLRAFGAGGLGVVFFALGVLTAPWVMKAHAVVSKNLLAPTKEQALRRVAELTETRTAAVDASAAELRRIERDLHDGAQARLVAMGMTLSAAEHVLETDPARARQLIGEARDASVTALNELRGLVRGILPPVLAERGLGDAVRALALAAPVQTDVTVTLPTRLAEPVESAAYFAVSETLANAVKHARATRIWIDLRHDGSVLRMTVGDDGRGGADASRGTGLTGIERRLSAFDGRLHIASPSGGPTLITMELPVSS
jgi:signal transduction histidine kinase